MFSRAEFPELQQLVAGGFVYGSDEFFGTSEEIISEYGRIPVTGRCLIDEISRLLVLDDDEVSAVLIELGNGYPYDAFGKSATQWLEQVRAQLVREVPDLEPRFVPLVGQRVERISSDDAVVLTLERAEVRFLHEVGCRGPIGVGKVGPHAGLLQLALLAAAVGESVIALVDTHGQLSLGTQRYSLHSLPSESGGVQYTIVDR